KHEVVRLPLDACRDRLLKLRPGHSGPRPKAFVLQLGRLEPDCHRRREQCGGLHLVLRCRDSRGCCAHQSRRALPDACPPCPDRRLRRHLHRPLQQRRPSAPAERGLRRHHRRHHHPQRIRFADIHRGRWHRAAAHIRHLSLLLREPELANARVLLAVVVQRRVRCRGCVLPPSTARVFPGTLRARRRALGGRGWPLLKAVSVTSVFLWDCN
ncbi:hypothetical protein CERSUDRAFT_115763, partial [Gelatoporia subvermispora B]